MNYILVVLNPAILIFNSFFSFEYWSTSFVLNISFFVFVRFCSLLASLKSFYIIICCFQIVFLRLIIFLSFLRQLLKSTLNILFELVFNNIIITINSWTLLIPLRVFISLIKGHLYLQYYRYIYGQWICEPKKVGNFRSCMSKSFFIFDIV